MATTSLTSLQAALADTIKTVLFDPTPPTPELQTKITALAAGIASDIDVYIEDVVSKITGSAVVTIGIPVQVVPATGTGATTSPGTATQVTLSTN